MKLINALNLDTTIVEGELLEMNRRKSFHRGVEMPFAKLDELKQTTFPPMRNEDVQMGLHDVKSDSSSSVTSSVAAHKFLEFVYDECDSLVEIDLDDDAPACSSLDLRSVDDNDSVSSTSSVAESAIELCVSAN